MQRAASFLGTKLQTAGGRAVVYRRGTKSVAITLTPQMHKETVVGEDDGVATEVHQYAWIVTLTELLLNGEMIEPQERDVIEETLNGQFIRWQVLPPGKDRQCWEWFDQNALLILIHVKRMP